jgi:hypothetical protein
LLQETAGKTRMTVEIKCLSPEQLDQFLQIGVDVGAAQTPDSLVAYARRWAARVA